MKLNRRNLFLASSATITLTLSTPVVQAQLYWDNNGIASGFGIANGTWADPTTADSTQGWSTDVTGVAATVANTTTTSGPASNLFFGNATSGLANGTIAITGNVSAGTMTFSDLTGNITFGSAANVGNLTLATTSTISVANTTRNVTINSAIIGGNLTKAGAGTLVLSGTNTYTGDTTVSEGTLSMTANRIANSTNIFIGNGASLAITGASNGFNMTAGQTITGTGASGSFTTGTNGIIFAAGGNNTISNNAGGTLTLNRISVFGTNNTISAGNIRAIGTNNRGVLIANGAGDTTLTISGGANYTTASTGATTLNDFVGNAGGNGTFIIGNGSYTNTANNGTLALGLAATGNSGSGTLTLLTGGSAAVNTLHMSGNSTTSSTVNLDGGNLTVNTITANGTTKTFNFNGGTLIAAGGFTLGNMTAVNVKDGGAKINTNGQNVTISDNLVSFAGNSTGGLTKSGAGILTLSGNNTYAGGSSITAGGLVFGSLAAKPTAGNHTFGNGTTLGLGVGGAGFFSSTDVNNALAGTMTGNLSNVTVTPTTNVGIDTTAGNFTYSVIGSPTRGLVKLGANELTLNLASPLALQNTPLTISGGSVGIGNVTSLTLGGLSGAGALTATGLTNLTLNTPVGVSVTYGGSITDGTPGMTVTKTGVGTQTLTGTNTYTGVTTISAGTLEIGSGGTTGDIANTTSITNNGALVYSRSDALAAAYDISGSGTLTKLGTGTLTLSGNNTYGGNTTIDGTGAGNNIVLTVSSNTALGNTTGGTTLIGSVSGSGAGATISLSNGVTVTDETLTFNTGVSGTRAAVITSGNATWAGNVVIASNAGIGSFQSTGTGMLTIGANSTNTFTLNGPQFVRGAGNTTINSTISGNGSLIKTDDGTLFLTAANTHTGNTDFNGGIGKIRLVDSLALGNSTVSFTRTTNTTSLLFDSSVVANAFTIGGLSATAAGNSKNIALQNDLSTAIALTVGSNNANTTYNGVLSAGGSLIKTGTGTLTLGGNNTHTGNTAISNGILALGANGSIANSPTITVASAAVLDVTAQSAFAIGANQTLTGGGSVTGNTTVNGNLAPGTGVGQITFSGGNLTLGTLAADSLKFELGANTTAGTTYDTVATSALDIGTGILDFPDFQFTGTPAAGTYTLISSASTTGTLGGNLTGPIGAFTGTLSQSGNNVILTVASSGNPYSTWSGGAGFYADANGDGVPNGMTWLLGGANTTSNGLALLPAPVVSGGNMTLSFKTPIVTAPAQLSFQYGNNLVDWSALVPVPIAGNSTGIVTFAVSPTPGNATTNNVILTVNGNASVGGKLFGRFNSKQN